MIYTIIGILKIGGINDQNNEHREDRGVKRENNVAYRKADGEKKFYNKKISPKKIESCFKTKNKITKENILKIFSKFFIRA